MDNATLPPRILLALLLASTLPGCLLKFDTRPVQPPEDGEADPDVLEVADDPDVTEEEEPETDVFDEDVEDMLEEEEDAFDVIEDMDAFDPVEEDPVEEDPGEPEPTNPYFPLNYYDRDLLTELTSLPISTWSIGTLPDSSRRSRWDTFLNTYLLVGDWTGTYSYNLTVMGHEVYAIRDTGATPPRDFIIVYDDANGEGVYVFDPAPMDPLVVEVPYPVMDAGTLEQGVKVLRGNPAGGIDGGWALLVAGAPRCSRTITIICDGTTVACTGGTPERFRESDVAHSANLIFERVHQVLFTFDTDAIGVQLQGQSDASGAYAIFSDGTTLDGTFPVGVSVAVRNALRTAIPGWSSSIFSCNAPGDSGYTSTCQLTNVQGRWTNGSGNLCNEDATSSADRLVIVEQNAAIRATSYHDELVTAVQAGLSPFFP